MLCPALVDMEMRDPVNNKKLAMMRLEGPKHRL